MNGQKHLTQRSPAILTAEEKSAFILSGLEIRVKPNKGDCFRP